MARYEARNIRDVMYYNQKIGHYFFSKRTMKCWGSKVESELYKNNTFITSEYNYNQTERLYTVRKYNPENAEIYTIGKFQQFKNKDDAKKFARAYKQ